MDTAPTNEQLIHQASAGDGESMLALGYRYAWGLSGIERNLSIALEWWNKAAQVNDRKVALEACSKLVNYYLKRDIEKALTYAKLKARRGEEDDLVKVAIAIVESSSIPGRDKDQLIQAKTEACDMLYEMSRWGNMAAKEAFNDILLYGDEKYLSEKTKVAQGRVEQRMKQQMHEFKRAVRICIGIISIVLMVWLYYASQPKIQAVFPDQRVEEKSSFGKITFMDENGKTLTFNGLNLFSNYIYNGTDTTLILRNICYHHADSTPADYIRQRYEIQPYRCVNLGHEVDFFFSYPHSLSYGGVRMHWLLALYYLYFAKDWEEKWLIESAR